MNETAKWMNTVFALNFRKVNLCSRRTAPFKCCNVKQQQLSIPVAFVSKGWSSPSRHSTESLFCTCQSGLLKLSMATLAFGTHNEKLGFRRYLPWTLCSHSSVFQSKSKFPVNTVPARDFCPVCWGISFHF